MTVTKLLLKRRSNLYRESKINPKGTEYELKDVASNIKWSTDMNFSAGELTFDLVEKPTLVIPYTGDIISFSWDKKKIFYGYVWKYQVKKDNVISVTCYDPMRYLKNQDSIVFKTGTITDRFNDVCNRAGIKHRVVKNSTHKVAAEICEGKTYFDMLKSAMDKTYTATNHKYFLFTKYDTVELRRVPNRKLKFYVGSKSGMTGFTYSVDINNTANVVKVIKKDSKKSKTKSATAKAKAKSTKETPANTSFRTMASAAGRSPQQWGNLQVIVNAKDKANQAQMLKQARDTLRQKNMANKTLTIDCIGNLNLIPGNAVTIKITDMKKTLKDCPIIKAVHNFDNNYTCQIQMKAGLGWQENGS
ncbi:XkdQ/YqbQ family protein [Lactobacillus sp. PSON]|uniref:XkdQ/YqbQ family protein n=1 Tax=Lactobacillus sp. PSON TaxID=3455454 RepID=UPI004041CC42